MTTRYVGDAENVALGVEGVAEAQFVAGGLGRQTVARIVGFVESDAVAVVQRGQECV